MKCLRCVFCVAGLLLVFAYDDLSHNKLATQSQTAVGGTFDASNAVDGNTASCMRTVDIGLNSMYKSVWWKVDLGGVVNIYNINIMFKDYEDKFKARQRGRFAGFSLLVSSTGDIQGSTLCYKDKQQLPPLNFTCICSQSGRYVIFYNERLDGVTYPTGYEVNTVIIELCEVTVQGCNKASVYGINCDRPCPTNCKDNTCHIQSGSCFNCEPGWVGTFCESKCGAGWYGFNCSQQCSGHCAEYETCNHVTGQCDRGCDAGWTGSTCNIECEDGTFGYHCKNNCSGHCSINSPCNKKTGHCDSGCKPGYTTILCNEICRSRYYGHGCGNLCNGYCVNNGVCDHVNGVCVAGCQDGYIGKYCNTSCIKGYFGRGCSSVCSPHCKTCRHTDGHCSCFAGFTGYRCNTACIQSYGDNCQYPCSQHCYNKNCDRFNGTCLTACINGFYGERCDKDMQMLRQETTSFISWILGLSISLAVNTILITTICIMCRRKHGVKEFIFGNWCWKKSDFYQDTNVQRNELSTYQELSVTLPKTELPYHNTTLK